MKRLPPRFWKPPRWGFFHCVLFHWPEWKYRYWPATGRGYFHCPHCKRVWNHEP